MAHLPALFQDEIQSSVQVPSWLPGGQWRPHGGLHQYGDRAPGEIAGISCHRTADLVISFFKNQNRYMPFAVP